MSVTSTMGTNLYSLGPGLRFTRCELRGAISVASCEDCTGSGLRIAISVASCGDCIGSGLRDLGYEFRYQLRVAETTLL